MQIDYKKFPVVNGIMYGDGSWGGDGFILAVTPDSEQLLWLASFEESNPFIRISCEDHFLYVTNNLYEVWRLDISDFAEIEIVIVKQSPYCMLE